MSFLKAHASRHRKRCKGLKGQLTEKELIEKRREYNRKSYRKHRDQRLREARAKNAKKMFDTMQQVRGALQIAEEQRDKALLPPSPRGLGEDHPLYSISLCPEYFEYMLSRLDKFKLLSTIWFRSSYRYLHSDKTSNLPPQFQERHIMEKITESCKYMGAFREQCADPDLHDMFVQEIQEYREYLRNEYPVEVAHYDRSSELQLANEVVTTLSRRLGRYAAFQDCDTFQSFLEVYLARFQSDSETKEDEFEFVC